MVSNWIEKIAKFLFYFFWHSPASSVDESELARKIVHRWQEGIAILAIFSVMCEYYLIKFCMKCCVNWEFWSSSFGRSKTSLQAVYWSGCGVDR